MKRLTKDQCDKLAFWTVAIGITVLLLTGWVKL